MMLQVGKVRISIRFCYYKESLETMIQKDLQKIYLIFQNSIIACILFWETCHQYRDMNQYFHLIRTVESLATIFKVMKNLLNK